MGDGQSRDNGLIFDVLMPRCPFFGHFGLNIGSATLLVVLLGLLGFQTGQYFGPSHLVLADILEEQ